MPIQTFDTPEMNAIAGQHTVSPSVAINNNPKSFAITLTSSEWAAKKDQGTIRFGIEKSTTGAGGPFTEWAYGNTIPIGYLGGKATPPVAMPDFKWAGGELSNVVGAHVRLFAEVTGVNLLVGAHIEVET
jgi:hypothetical protein